MATTQPRSQNGKATPEMIGRNALVAAGATRGNGEKNPNPASGISTQERELLVARLAYSRAEKRGFVPGNELQDWFEAEAEVELLLS